MTTMMIKPVNKSRRANAALQRKRAPLFSSGSPWIILMLSGLLFVQTTSLSAMEKADLSEELGKNQASPSKFPRDAKHPLTQGFWKENDLSKKLESIRRKIKKIKKHIIGYEINFISINDNELYDYTKMLQCFSSDSELVKGLSEITFNHLIITPDDLKNKNNGFSGAIVPPPLSCKGTKVIIKKFTNILEGLYELLYSLIALDTNPSPQELKMARIYDAAFCSKNSKPYLSIIMECARGQDINHFLPTNQSKNAVRACAEYLALFHVKNYQNLEQSIKREKYVTYASTFFHSLLENILEEAKKNIKLLSLEIGEQKNDLTDDKVKSDTIVRLLSKREQKDFKNLVEKCCELFKENSREIFRLLETLPIEKGLSYFLTTTHGDGHSKNFFYESADDVRDQNGSAIGMDSCLRVTTIDYATFIRTYGNIGDPSEDIGRFLGSLWEWAAQQGKTEKEDIDQEIYNKIKNLQDNFIRSYFKKIKEHENANSIKINWESFEKSFQENLNFYKLRFYRVIFNSNQSKEVKLKILRSWLKENAQLVKSLRQTMPLKTLLTKKAAGWCWKRVNGTTYSHLPPRSTEFVESIAENSNKSYLRLLWEELHRTGRATLSSIATIASMGGVGKTSLALEYAHEAFVNGAYNWIFWVPSETVESLLQGYRKLLQEMEPSIEGADGDYLIAQLKDHVPQWGKGLLIFDNVPNAQFLENKVPDNTHILITSRCKKEWKNPPILLDIFTPKYSVQYLLNVTSIKNENPKYKEIETSAGALAKELQHFPLALAHAAHYLKLEGGNDVSKKHFDNYLTALKEDLNKQLEGHKDPFTETHSKITYEYLIGNTLKMAKEKLSPLAEKLLTYSAYLNPDAIEEDIFLEHWEKLQLDHDLEDQTLESEGIQKDISLSVDERKEKLNKALSKLLELSLIKKSENKSIFSIHRLLQVVICKNSPQKNQFSIENISRLFNELFEEKFYSYEYKTKENLLHMIQAVKNSQFLDITCPDLDRLKKLSRILLIVIREYSKKNASWGKKDADEQMVLEKANDLELEFNNLQKATARRKNHFGTNFFYAGFGSTLTSSLDLWDPFEENLRRLCLPNFSSNNAIKPKKTDAQYVHKLMTSQQYSQIIKSGEAFTFGQERAEQGNAEAQYTLGLTYEWFRVFQKAIEWYKKAAEQGFKKAQLKLGVIYENAQGVDKDDKQAFKWYQEASKKGAKKATFKLGIMYENAQGIDKNEDKAFICYQNATEQGHALAKDNRNRIMYTMLNSLWKNIKDPLQFEDEVKREKERFDQEYNIIKEKHDVIDKIMDNIYEIIVSLRGRIYENVKWREKSDEHWKEWNNLRKRKNKIWKEWQEKWEQEKALTRIWEEMKPIRLLKSTGTTDDSSWSNRNYIEEPIDYSKLSIETKNYEDAIVKKYRIKPLKWLTTANEEKCLAVMNDFFKTREIDKVQKDDIGLIKWVPEMMERPFLWMAPPIKKEFVYPLKFRHLKNQKVPQDKTATFKWLKRDVQGRGKAKKVYNQRY